MPGFVIGTIGGNRTSALSSERFYASYAWEIVDINSKLPWAAKVFQKALLLKSATLPTTTFQKVETEGGTVKYKFAGKPEFDDITISWHDTQYMSTFYKDWYATIFNNGSGVSAPNVYKGNAILSKYLMDRPDTGETGNSGSESSGLVKYRLFGAWPTSFKESELTYAEASIKHITISLTYDYFEMDLSDD